MVKVKAEFFFFVRFHSRMLAGKIPGSMILDILTEPTLFYHFLALKEINEATYLSFPEQKHQLP